MDAILNLKRTLTMSFDLIFFFLACQLQSRLVRSRTVLRVQRLQQCTHGYTPNYAKLVLLELASYDVPVQSTVSLFQFCIAWSLAVCTVFVMYKRQDTQHKILRAPSFMEQYNIYTPERSHQINVYLSRFSSIFF